MALVSVQPVPWRLPGLRKLANRRGAASGRNSQSTASAPLAWPPLSKTARAPMAKKTRSQSAHCRAALEARQASCFGQVGRHQSCTGDQSGDHCRTPGGVHHQIGTGNQAGAIGRIKPHHQRLGLTLGVQHPCAGSGGKGFGLADVGKAVKCLSVQVGHLDLIRVNDRQPPHPRRRQRRDHRAAKAPRPDDQHLRRRQPRLPDGPDARYQQTRLIVQKQSTPKTVVDPRGALPRDARASAIQIVQVVPTRAFFSPWRHPYTGCCDDRLKPPCDP